jgi:hypothetical protein
MASFYGGVGVGSGGSGSGGLSISNIEIDKNIAMYNFEPFTEEGTYTVSVYQNGVEISNHFRV